MVRILNFGPGEAAALLTQFNLFNLTQIHKLVFSLIPSLHKLRIENNKGAHKQKLVLLEGQSALTLILLREDTYKKVFFLVVGPETNIKLVSG